MEILTQSELQLRYQEILEKIRRGAVFIYATDTIYGIGCDARNEQSVAKIREIKQREDSPFSVWVPSKEWVEKNCIVSEKAKSWLNHLPGPFTLIIKSNSKIVAPNVAPSKDSLGIRMPDHWFQRVISDLKPAPCILIRIIHQP